MLYPDNEWSLIIFNILGQMSVGAFLALGITHYYAVRKAGLRHADLLSTRALLALGPILVLGMLAVFGHVGNPDRVFNMLSNLDTSWLAREVAAYGAFLVIGGVFAVLQVLTCSARMRTYLSRRGCESGSPRYASPWPGLRRSSACSLCCPPP